MGIKAKTFLIPNPDSFQKEPFQRKLEQHWLRERQFFAQSFRPLKCRCVTGNCRHHTGKCVPIKTEGECSGQVVSYKYSRSGFGVIPHDNQNTAITT